MLFIQRIWVGIWRNCWVSDKIIWLWSLRLRNWCLAFSTKRIKNRGWMRLQSLKIQLTRFLMRNVWAHQRVFQMLWIMIFKGLFLVETNVLSDIWINLFILAWSYRWVCFLKVLIIWIVIFIFIFFVLLAFIYFRLAGSFNNFDCMVQIWALLFLWCWLIPNRITHLFFRGWLMLFLFSTWS